MDPSLYVILDRGAARGRDLTDLLEAALAGGCRMVQLREKEWPSGRVLPLAQRLRARCATAGATFIVNDRVDMALATNADGVHVGQDDLPAAEARRLIGPGRLLGVSVRSVAEAVKAAADGADYLGAGPVFDARTTKPDADRPIGLEGLREICRATALPVIAGFGIRTPADAAAMSKIADGVVVGSAFVQQIENGVNAQDIGQQAAALKQAI